MAVKYVWITQDGAAVEFCDMTASHLFYSLRMLFNHLAPVELRIHGCRHYHGIEEWPRAYARRAVTLLCTHLKPRLSELKAWQLEQLRYMVSQARILNIAQLDLDTRAVFGLMSPCQCNDRN